MIADVIGDTTLQW